MKIEVLDDRVVIKRIDLEAKTESGIILGNEVEKDRDTGYGKVVAVGEGKRVIATGDLIPTKTKVGDIIAFNDRQPLKTYFKGEEFGILRESDVFFIVRDESVTEVAYEKATTDYDNLMKRMG
jgi:chaperonin GroES